MADETFEDRSRRFLSPLSTNALEMLLRETEAADAAEKVRHSDFAIWERLIREELERR